MTSTVFNRPLDLRAGKPKMRQVQSAQALHSGCHYALFDFGFPPN